MGAWWPAEQPLVMAKGAGHVCRCTVLFVPLPGGCDMFILFPSCVNCCSPGLQGSDKVLELTGCKK